MMNSLIVSIPLLFTKGKTKKRKMSNVMLVVSVKMRNIAFLQPQAGSDDTTINYFFPVKILSIVLI